MDVIKGAIANFEEVKEFYYERQSKIRSEYEDVEAYELAAREDFFVDVIRRYVLIAKKIVVDAYDDFDCYVVEKHRNPFALNKKKKVRFGRKKFNLSNDVEPEEIFELYDRIGSQFLKPDELEAINKLYDGTEKIVRLQLFLDEIKNDAPAEKGEQRQIQIRVQGGGKIVGLLTFNSDTYGSSQRDIDDHLEVTNSCKSVCGPEAHFMDAVNFGLKLIVGKLYRMKCPYVTTIQNVEKVQDLSIEFTQEKTTVEELTEDLPLEGRQIVSFEHHLASPTNEVQTISVPESDKIFTDSVVHPKFDKGDNKTLEAVDERPGDFETTQVSEKTNIQKDQSVFHFIPQKCLVQ